MKEFFQNLLAYNHYANNLLLSQILNEMPDNTEAVKLMSHILNAQQIWLLRLQDKDSSGISVWAWYEAEKLQDIMDNDHSNWGRYLDDLQSQYLDKIASYKNSKGDVYENLVKDIIFHTFNHATHHRAQISRMLREQDIIPPTTDYIFYKRDN